MVNYVSNKKKLHDIYSFMKLAGHLSTNHKVVALRLSSSCQVRRSGSQSVFSFNQKVFSGVEVRAPSRPLEFLHFKLGKPCPHGARFVKRNCNATAHPSQLCANSLRKYHIRVC